MSTTWKTVRVFISSTFRDMHAERDWLVKRVFPALRQRLEPHRINLVDIDLRWGITREQADNDQVLGLCLQQIDECRPFFVGLLGGRYGWVPSKFPVEVGKRYGWTQNHTGKSVTELEVLHGVLNDPAMHGRALFCFRSEDFLRDIKDEEKRRVYVEGSTDEELHELGPEEAEPRAAVRRQQLADLKNRIRALSPPMPLFDGYPCTWDQAAVDPVTKKPGRVGGLAELGNWILDKLERAILEASELQEHLGAVRTEKRDDLAEERGFHERFIESRTRVYIGRQQLQDELKAFVTGAEAKPCLVTGPSGSGKSAALAKFVHDLASAPSDIPHSAFIIHHFVGASPRSTGLRDVLRHLCAELKDALKLEDEIKQDIRELCDQFREFLAKVPAERHVVVVVDALNQLDEVGNAHSLYWLPGQIPPPVRLIVSCIDDPDRTNQPALAAMRSRQLHEIKVGLLTDDERLGILREIPSVAAKTLDEQQVRLLLANEATRNPLFLLVALEELRGFGSFEQLNLKIAGLPQTGDTLTAIFQQVGRRLGEDFDAVTVKEVLALLACSRHGLSERELLDLLEGEQVMIEESAGDLFPILRQLRPYLQRRGDLVDFHHGNLLKAVQEHYLCPTQTAQSSHAKLARYFGRQADPHRNQTWLGDSARALDELTHHLTHANLWSEVEATLCDFVFIRTKCSLCSVHRLQEDYVEALAAWQTNEAASLTAPPRGQLMDRSKPAPSPGKSPSAESEIVTDKPEAQSTSDLLAAIGRLPLNQRAFDMSHPGILRGLGQATEHPLVGAAMVPPPPSPLKTTMIGGAFPQAAAEQPCARLSAFSTFVSTFCTVLPKLGDALVPFAYNHAQGGPVSSAAAASLETRRAPWVERRARPPRLPDVPLCRFALSSGGTPLRTLSLNQRGTRIVAVGADGLLRVWSASTGQLENVIQTHQLLEVDRQFRGSMACDAAGCVASTVNGDLRVWNLDSSQLQFRFGGTKHNACLAMAPDARFVVADTGSSLALFDLRQGLQTSTLPVTCPVESVAFSVDGKLLVVAGGGSVQMIDLATASVVRSLFNFPGALDSLAISGDAQLLFQGCRDGALRVWDLLTGELVRELRGHEDAITSVAVTPCGSVAVSAGTDRIVRVWSIPTGRILRVLRGHSDWVNCVSVSCDGSIVVSSADDGTVCVWDVAGVDRSEKIGRHPRQVDQLIVASRSKWVVSACERMVCAWDAGTGASVRSWEFMLKHRPTFACRWFGTVVAAPDGASLLAADTLGRVHQCDIGSGRDRVLFSSECGNIHNILPLPGENIVLVDGPRKLLGYDPSSGRCLASLVRYPGYGRLCRLTPDARLILSDSAESGLNQSGLNLWSLFSGNLYWSAAKDEEYGSCAAIFPDGRRVALPARNHSIIVFDLRTKQRVVAMPGHEAPVNAIAVTPDGRFVVTASDDTTLRVWDVNIAACVAIYYATAPVSAVSNISPDGLLACGTRDGFIHILALRNLAFGPPVVTIVKQTRMGDLFLGASSQDDLSFPSADAECPWCGGATHISGTALSALREAIRAGSDHQIDSPCLELPLMWWDDPRLHTECRSCGRAVRLNPFAVGLNSELQPMPESAVRLPMLWQSDPDFIIKHLTDLGAPNEAEKIIEANEAKARASEDPQTLLHWLKLKAGLQNRLGHPKAVAELADEINWLAASQKDGSGTSWKDCNLGTDGRMREARSILDDIIHSDDPKTAMLRLLKYAIPKESARGVDRPTVQINDPLAQPRKEPNLAQLRESAARCFHRGFWEAAAGDLSKLLERGESLAEHAPKLIACLLNAHEQLLPGDAAKIESLLGQLEAAGHAALAAPLRQEFSAKRTPVRKPWWKIW